MSNMLHQVLAVESDLNQQAKNISDECLTTFVKKADHFDGIEKLYKPYNEDGEKKEPEIKDVVTTVDEKLDYTEESMIKAIDATLTKEETNASGKAKNTITINGKTVTLSATSLIALEKYLVRIRDQYKAIPTLDPTKRWGHEDGSGRNLWVTAPEVKFRTIKVTKPLVLSPATEKFPAQVQMIQDDIQAGQYETVYSSGRYSLAQKSALLAKIDNLILEVKMAREKANQVEAIQIKLGEEIFRHLR